MRTPQNPEWTLTKGDRTYTTNVPSERANLLADGWTMKATRGTGPGTVATKQATPARKRATPAKKQAAGKTAATKSDKK